MTAAALLPTAAQVELLMGRLTNVPAFLPFAWQRSLNGVLMGAVPHALEDALGFVFDAADGGDYYARKRNELFRQRHPGRQRGSCIAAGNTRQVKGVSAILAASPASTLRH